MNFRCEPMNGSFSYNVIFNAYEDDKIVNDRFNIIYDPKKPEIQFMYNLHIENEQCIYSIPVIEVLHQDYDEEVRLEVVLSVGKATDGAAFEDGTYRNLGDETMERRANVLIDKLTSIMNVRPRKGFCSTLEFSWIKPWSYKEYERVIDEIGKIRIH